jgi:CHAT domain-containing protein
MIFIKKAYSYLVVLFLIGLFFSTHVRAESDTLAKVNNFLLLGQTENVKELIEQFLSTNPDPDSTFRAKGFLANANALEGKYLEAISIYEDLYRNSRGEIQTTAANNLTSTSIDLVNKLERDLVLVSNEGDLKEKARLEGEIAKQKAKTEIYRQQALSITEGQRGAERIAALLHAERLEEAVGAIDLLPASSQKINLLLQLANKMPQPLPYLLEAKSLTTEPRTVSFIWQRLGDFYYSSGDYPAAEAAVGEAIQLSRAISAGDLLYRQWYLLGNVYQKQGEETKAIEAWQHGIASIQTIRGDLAIASRNYRLDFDEQIDPIYKKSIDSLLRANRVEEALSVADLRQLSELEAFFGDICLSLEKNILPIQKNKATISTFIFDDRLEVLLQLPDGSYYRHQSAIEGEAFIARLKQYRRDLEDGFNNSFFQFSGELYDLLIRPLESQLQEGVELVFVNEGILRNIPMATLYDGAKYLIEKYPISYSLSPRLRIPDFPNNDRVSKIFGLSLAVDGWKALPEVDKEVETVSKILDGDVNLNADFTIERFARTIEEEQPNIIHIATHGQFTGARERSFLVAFDGKIAIPELEQILSRGNSNLLVLSACKTAAGNNKSVMGLSGVALRSGIPTTVGSLWSLSDIDIAESIKLFYTYFDQGFTYPQALQKAQIELIKNTDPHPSIWSSLVLLSN